MILSLRTLNLVGLLFITTAICAKPQKAEPTHKQRTNSLKNATKSAETNPTEQKKNLITPPATVNVKTQVSSKNIAVTNAISDKTLAYNYCFLSYSPTSFDVTVNGQPLGKKESKSIPVTNNKLTVRYDYAFLHGKRKGAKEIEFELSPHAQAVDLTFSWHKESHIIIDGAKATSIVKIY